MQISALSWVPFLSASVMSLITVQIDCPFTASRRAYVRCNAFYSVGDSLGIHLSICQVHQGGTAAQGRCESLVPF